MKIVLIPFVALVALTVLAEKQPFERYQSIVDRQMFGPLPPGFDPTKMPSEVQKSSASEKELTQEQEKLQSSIHFSAINVTPEGATAVGFTDNSDPKTPVHYYLKVGEKRNGWEVKEADPVAATMTIAKDEIEVSLSLGGNSAKDGGTSKAGGAARPSRPGGLGGGLRSSLLGGGNSLLAKRKQRRQAEAAEKAEADAAAAEKEAERQAQAEADKAQREAERAEQRQQLMAIQEELRKVREAKAAAERAESAESESNEDN